MMDKEEAETWYNLGRDNSFKYDFENYWNKFIEKGCYQKIEMSKSGCMQFTHCNECLAFPMGIDCPKKPIRTCVGCNHDFEELTPSKYGMLCESCYAKTKDPHHDQSWVNRTHYLERRNRDE